MQKLEDILKNYGINGRIVNIKQGPLVILAEFLPAPGTKIKNITSSLDDIARELGVPSLRVEALEENNTIGFELPAPEMETIDFKSLLDSSEFLQTKGTLPLLLGVDITGRPIVADLAKMPHLLVAGTTGSGKSVGLNSFILSLISKKKPSELKFVMIDPKRIEFGIYNNQKYMLMPVVTEMSEASAALSHLVEEMEKRYELFEENLVKNIADYNAGGKRLPYIVCVIDEFADLIASDKKVETSVQRLAQKARAAGIHIILATQRPSVDIVTGVLKANFPTRLSYKTASSADSRTILDISGAEKLLGRGDALFLSADGHLKRLHGAFIADNEIAAMLEPFRTPVLPLPHLQNSKQNESTTGKNKKGFLRTIWDFWSSLRQKDRKLIISGFTFLLETFTGSRSKKRR